MTIALPTIQAGLHFSETDLGWVQNIYHLISGGSYSLEGGQPDESYSEQLVPLVRGAGMDER
jgi:hypothetical protein